MADVNIKDEGKFSFEWRGFSSGQRQAMMRNLVVKLTEIALKHQCPIAIESLDFSQKKASMSEESKLYNKMLSNLVNCGEEYLYHDKISVLVDRVATK